MSETKFTPGPWIWTDGLGAWDGVLPLPEYPAFDSLENTEGHAVLTGVWCNDRTGMIGLEGDAATVRANARLIAAAPALYDAAQVIRTRHKGRAVASNFEDCGCDDCAALKAALLATETP